MKPLTSDEWFGSLEAAGLRDIIERTYEINTRNEARGILRRHVCTGMLGVFGRILSLYARNPAYRRFVRKVHKEGIKPCNLEEYFGYGLYVGRK